MADDRMRNDEQDRQSPGRKKQDDDFATGQREANQRGTERQGEQKHMKDDFGTSEKSDVGQEGRDL